MDQRERLNGGSPLAISGDGTRIAAGALLADIGGNVDQVVHDGRVWLYTGHDGAESDASFFEMDDWQLYASVDRVEWTHHGSPISVETFEWARADAWASQVIERDGQFYFYSTVRHDETNPGFAIGVAMADRPEGPFSDARCSALVPSDMTKGPIVNGREMGWDDLDPTVWHEDGQAWLMWGNTQAYIAPLADSMTELAGPIGRLDLPEFTRPLGSTSAATPTTSPTPTEVQSGLQLSEFHVHDPHVVAHEPSQTDYL